MTSGTHKMLSFASCFRNGHPSLLSFFFFPGFQVYAFQFMKSPTFNLMSLSGAVETSFNPWYAALFSFRKLQSFECFPGGLGSLPGLWQSRKITRWHHPVSPDIKARQERRRKTFSITGCRPLLRLLPELRYHWSFYPSLVEWRTDAHHYGPMFCLFSRCLHPEV